MKPLEKKLAIGGFVVAVGSLGIAALEYTRTSAVPALPAGPPPEQPPVRVQVEQTPPAPPARLPQLLTERTIGRQLQYFEGISGPAQEVHGNRRFYQVDGCDLEIELGSEQQIEALSVRVTPACSFEWRDMAHNITGLGLPEQTTLSQFLNYVDQGNIAYVGGCASSCGNAADPEIWLRKPGSRADDFIDLTVGVTIDTMREAELLGRLSTIVEANLGADSGYELSRTCDRRMVDWISTTLGALRIERVELRTQDVAYPPGVCDLTRL